MLVAAEYPVLVADRLARTPNGMKLLVDLADTLQAAVIDQGSRMNFPSRLGGNWEWRMTEEDMSEAVAQRIREFNELYLR